MIVDDDITVTQLLTALLAMEGHETTTVNDSSQAMEAVAAFQPDLIMLDLMMPGLTGFDLCDLLHQDPRFANIPVLVVSAMDDQESRYKAMQAGAREFITKPFRTTALMQKINDVLNLPNP